MSSFSIADTTTSLELVAADSASAERHGEISFSVRNTTAQTKTARLRIESADGADDDWFSFVDAPATNPRFMEIDFADDSAQTIKVSVKAEGQQEDKVCKFRLRATAESDPDNDFVEGPWVELKVPKFEPKPEPKKGHPWWPYAVGALVLIIVGGFMWYWLFGGGPDPVMVKGQTQAEATLRLTEAGYTTIETRTLDEATGERPGHVVGTEPGSEGKHSIVLLLDPGVRINAGVNDDITTAAQRLSNAGFRLDLKTRWADSGNFHTVVDIDPNEGTLAAMGSTVEVTVLKFCNLSPQGICLRVLQPADLSAVMGTSIARDYAESQAAMERVLQQLQESGQLVQDND